MIHNWIVLLFILANAFSAVVMAINLQFNHGGFKDLGCLVIDISAIFLLLQYLFLQNLPTLLAC